MPTPFLVEARANIASKSSCAYYWRLTFQLISPLTLVWSQWKVCIPVCSPKMGLESVWYRIRQAGYQDAVPRQENASRAPDQPGTWITIPKARCYRMLMDIVNDANRTQTLWNDTLIF